MFRSSIRYVWGHAAIFAKSDLILDRSRTLVDLLSPAAYATRAGGDSGPNSENYDLFHAQSPGTGHRTRFSRPLVAGELGRRRQALVLWVLFEGTLAGPVTRRPQRGREKAWLWAPALQPY